MRYVTKYFTRRLEYADNKLREDLSESYTQTDLLTLTSVIPAYASLVTGKVGVGATFECQYGDLIREVLVLRIGDKDLEVTEEQRGLIEKRIDELSGGPRMFLVLPLVGTLEVSERQLTPFWIRHVFPLVQEELGMFLAPEGICILTGSHFDTDGIDSVNEELLNVLIALYDQGVVPSTPELAEVWQLEKYLGSLYQVPWKDGRLCSDPVRFLLQRFSGQTEVRLYSPEVDEEVSKRIFDRVRNYCGVEIKFDGDYVYAEVAGLKEARDLADLVESA